MGEIRAGHYLIVNKLLEAASDVLSFRRPHEQIEVTDSWTTAQQFLDEDFAHETRRAGDEHRAAFVKLDDLRVAHRVICVCPVVRLNGIPIRNDGSRRSPVEPSRFEDSSERFVKVFE